MKSHMRIHLNSGNNIETPDQMKDAILSSGGVPSVNVTLCEPMAATNITALKIPGVSLLNNIKLERNTLLDKAALTYAEALEGETAGVPQLETCTMPVSAHNDSNMKMGWALKTSGSKVRFTSTQVSYLTSKFKIGEETGQKANPASVARAMRTGKDTNGNPFFTYEYFLTF